MRPTTSNIFHTSLDLHLSSLTARTRSSGNRDVGSQCCTTGFRNGTGGMGLFSAVAVGPEALRIAQGGNA
jgi:hypothetical protein